MTPDAAFGFERQGTPEALTVLGANDGFEVVVVPPFDLDGRQVRSTEIREAIRTGELSFAAVARPPSPVDPAVPVPATVVTTPLVLILRIECRLVSVKYTSPAALIAMPHGWLMPMAVACWPSPEYVDAPLPIAVHRMFLPQPDDA